MHIHLFIIIIFFYSLFLQDAEKKLHLTKIGEIELIDTIQASYKNHFSEFAYDEGKIFYITDSPASLSIYSIKTGSQEFYKQIQGAGPFEHQNLYNITVSNKRVYLLGYTGKISSWSMNGEPLSEKETGITRAKEIAVTKQSLIIAHEKMGQEKYLYHTSASADIDTIQNFGPPQVFENVLFSVFRNGGVLKTIDNLLYVIPPFGNRLWVFNSSTLQLVEHIDLAIPGFSMQKASENRNSYFNDPALIKTFFEKNSLITGFYKIDDSFLVEVLHMHNNYKRDLIIYNNDFTVQCHKTLNEEIDTSSDPKIRFSDGKYIYYYQESTADKNTIKKTLSYFKPVCK